MNNNYGLVYPSRDSYYNVDVFNSNFSKLADGIDIVKSAGSKSQIIVAAYNSKNPLKGYSDLVCSAGDCSDVFAQALEKAEEGGEILLLDGDFYLKKTFEINRSVTIKGLGKKVTRINKHIDIPVTERAIIHMSATDISLYDLGIYNNEDETGVHCVTVLRPGQTIDNCYFIMGSSQGSGLSQIYLSNKGGYVRISNCIFEKYNDLQYSIYIDNVWYGAIYGNCCINADNNESMPLKINLYSDKSRQGIGFGAQNAAVYLNGILKEG